MLRTLSRVLTIAALTSVAGLAPNTAAWATSTAALETCPINSLCGWSGSYFTGGMTTFRTGAGCQNSPVLLRSVANTWPSSGVLAGMHVYSGSGCTGALLGYVRDGASLLPLPTWGLSVYATI